MINNLITFRLTVNVDQTFVLCKREERQQNVSRLPDRCLGRCLEFEFIIQN